METAVQPELPHVSERYTDRHPRNEKAVRSICGPGVAREWEPCALRSRSLQDRSDNSSSRQLVSTCGRFIVRGSTSSPGA
jgi:hypothetical protein